MTFEGILSDNSGSDLPEPQRITPNPTFSFPPIPIIQPVSRQLRSGHPISKDPGPGKLQPGETVRAFDRSPLAGIGTDQAGADREGSAIDRTLADAVRHRDLEHRSRSAVPPCATSGSSHASQPPHGLVGTTAPTRAARPFSRAAAAA